MNQPTTTAPGVHAVGRPCPEQAETDRCDQASGADVGASVAAVRLSRVSRVRALQPDQQVFGAEWRDADRVAVAAGLMG